jgi:hypothetical protein
MFLPPVVGKAFQAQLRKHRRSFLRPPLLRIEWHDAPSNKIVMAEEFLGPRGKFSPLLRGADPCHVNNQEEAGQQDNRA